MYLHTIDITTGKIASHILPDPIEKSEYSYVYQANEHNWPVFQHLYLDMYDGERVELTLHEDLGCVSPSALHPESALCVWSGVSDTHDLVEGAKQHIQKKLDYYIQAQAQVNRLTMETNPSDSLFVKQGTHGLLEALSDDRLKIKKKASQGNVDAETQERT